MSTATAVLRQLLQPVKAANNKVPMSTATAVLRQHHHIVAIYFLWVPMSTATAVLRHEVNAIFFPESGTYVYRYGGIETLSFLVVTNNKGTYVYRYGGIETFCSFP